ncbi:MAG: HAMP domain-containing sensor histidine kinase [Streptosporangiaceae bacterium]
MPSAEVARPERHVADAAWAALVLLNLVAIVAWPSWDTIPFHLISIGFALLYGLRLWPADPVLWGLGIVIITTIAGISLDLLHDNEQIEEVAEIPLLAAMFVVTVWHANRRITADRERQLIGEKNTRLLDAQRRFLQDASHHLRTPITIALTHAELLARDLDGRELRDIQLVVSEIIRLRRLAERLLVIAAAEDPDFLRTEPVMLDEFAVEVITRWRPTAPRQWKLGPLDPVRALADPERLGLAVDALVENAIRHTGDDDVVQLSVSSSRDGQVRVAVSDSGSGIETAELDRVFDRFRTASSPQGPRGTGLGLSLVRAIAVAHGGSARVRSVRGEGSEFEIWLPAIGDGTAEP